MEDETLRSDMHANIEQPALFKITQAQKERMEKSKMKAKALKHARLTSHYHPYKNDQEHKTETGKVASRDVTSATSRGGYMIDGNDKEAPVSEYKLVEEEVPPLPGEEDVCCECCKKFAISFLKTNFSVSVCDNCRDGKGKHKLVSKTEAKQMFCLKDVDFEERDGPPLPFINRRNPHHPHGGSMKLFLESQVRSRSHSIWGGEEGLSAEQEKKSRHKEKLKQNKYEKKIKELRRAVSGGMQKAVSRSHQHTFPPGSAVHNEEEDTWTKTCSECGYQMTYEEM